MQRKFSCEHQEVGLPRLDEGRPNDWVNFLQGPQARDEYEAKFRLSRGVIRQLAEQFAPWELFVAPETLSKNGLHACRMVEQRQSGQ
ncbi:hypothetical protein CEXT_569801 [Caerostris extrusa]|uniref:Uncharacterized protein n=1 Tax=Caerostris extrusa TaxID=172846 RepID=A0AAV4VTR3_CAEEX|nr:hypothetical protein CEXT_569801 [Caerostris extrusa]